MSEQDRVDDIAGAVISRYRQRALRTLGLSEEQIDEAFEAMAPRVRRRLKAIGHSPEQVEQILREEWERHFDKRLGAIGETITEAHKAGAAAEPTVFERIFGDEEGADADPFGEGSGSPPKRKP